MEIDVFLLAGQSNASGNGDFFDVNLDARPVQGVLQWDSASSTVISAVSPLRHHTAPPRVGFGYHFGVMYKQFTDRDVLLVPRAKDGSRLYRDFWEPGTPGASGFEDAIAQCNSALKATTGRFAGVLWHQGEADSMIAPSEEDHSIRLKNLADAWRSRIACASQSVFLCGGMVPDWVAMTPEAAPIEAALLNIATYCQRSAYVSSEGLVGNHWPNDQIHFNAVSQRELGRRYLAAYLELVN